jgi:hypothetical protein
MDRDVAVANFTRSEITVTHSNRELIRAVNEIVDVYGKSHVAAMRDSRCAGKLRVIAGNHKRIHVTTFKANTASRVVVVVRVPRSFFPLTWLNMEVEEGLTAVDRN